jgi:hypothetical protein
VNQSHKIREATFITNHIPLESLPHVGRSVPRRSITSCGNELQKVVQRGQVARVTVRRWLCQRPKDVKYRLSWPAGIFALTYRNIKRDISQPQPFSTLQVSPEKKIHFPLHFNAPGAPDPSKTLRISSALSLIYRPSTCLHCSRISLSSQQHRPSIDSTPQVKSGLNEQHMYSKH